MGQFVPLHEDRTNWPRVTVLSPGSIIRRRFQLTPGYFRYIVLDLSGSIAYSNHATINLKSGIRSFFQE